jgi:hypothetical protein
MGRATETVTEISASASSSEKLKSLRALQARLSVAPVTSENAVLRIAPAYNFVWWPSVRAGSLAVTLDARLMYADLAQQWRDLAKEIELLEQQKAGDERR